MTRKQIILWRIVLIFILLLLFYIFAHTKIENYFKINRENRKKVIIINKKIAADIKSNIRPYGFYKKIEEQQKK